MTTSAKHRSSWFTRKIHWRLFKYLNANLIRYYQTMSLDNLGVNKESDVIVSLTSYPGRINLVHFSIRSILNQTKRPKKVVLWLGKEFFVEGERSLPNSILELKPFGLEIEFCDDLKAHTKYFYVFQKYPDNLIVTIDDDIIYPINLIEILLKTYHKSPNSVVANRVRYMEMDENNFKPYRQWRLNKFNETPSKKLFATGVSGVLYQPRFFNEAIFDVDGIKQTECIGDDVWLKACQILSGVAVVSTNYYFRQFIEIPESQNENLHTINVFKNDNDRQIDLVFNYFGITKNMFD